MDATILRITSSPMFRAWIVVLRCSADRRQRQPGPRPSFGRRAVLAVVTGVLSCAMACAPAKSPSRARPRLDRALAEAPAWSIDYDCQHPPGERVGLFVTDPSSRCDPRAFDTASRSVWLAYVSIGEVNEAYPRYAELVNAGAVVGANAHWPGAHIVDLRHPAYRTAYLEPTLASIAAHGYSGVFLDTLDEAVARAHDAVVTVVRDIRAQHPEWVIVPNGGLDASYELRAYVDAWAAEDVFEGYDFAARGYRATDPYRQTSILPRLRGLRDAGLPVLTVDYAWDDAALHASIRERSRAEGFHPLVMRIDTR